MPIGNQCILDFEVELVDQDLPILFGLDQQRKYQCSTNEISQTITHHPSGTVAPLIFVSKNKNEPDVDTLWIKWNASHVLFSRSELKQLNKQYGHPANEAFINLLKKSIA